MAIKLPVKNRKFFQDAIWNYSAFAVMALTGVILNFFIAWKMGLEALGVFNQIYAIYVILGQLAAFGVNDSAQKHRAEYDTDNHINALVGETAFWISLGAGLIAALLLFAVSGTIGAITESIQVGRGVVILSPAVCLFAVNKVLLGILNGARRMKTFAMIQIIRISVILVVCLWISIQDLKPYLFATSFLAAEVLITPILLYYTKAWLWPFKNKEALVWFKKHITFGAKALSGGFLSESYIRIDILILSIFVSDLKVGIYSFAALFVEGLFQLPVVIRTISNPVLVKLISNNDPISLVRFVKNIAPISAGVYGLMALIILICFPLLSNIYPAELIDSAHELLFVLLAGLLVYAVFIPFDYVLLQSGMPGRQSLLFTVNVIANVVLNIIFIPIFGIWGAALATAISFVLSALSLNFAASLWLGCRKGLIFNP